MEIDREAIVGLINGYYDDGYTLSYVKTTRLPNSLEPTEAVLINMKFKAPKNWSGYQTAQELKQVKPIVSLVIYIKKLINKQYESIKIKSYKPI